MLERGDGWFAAFTFGGFAVGQPQVFPVGEVHVGDQMWGVQGRAPARVAAGPAGRVPSGWYMPG